jgi:hypothetical protein
VDLLAQLTSESPGEWRWQGERERERGRERERERKRERKRKRKRKRTPAEDPPRKTPAEDLRGRPEDETTSPGGESHKPEHSEIVQFQRVQVCEKLQAFLITGFDPCGRPPAEDLRMRTPAEENPCGRPPAEDPCGRPQGSPGRPLRKTPRGREPLRKNS